MPPGYWRLAASPAEALFHPWRREIHVHARCWTSTWTSPPFTLAAPTRRSTSRTLVSFLGRSSVRGEFQSRDRCDHFIVNLTATSATALHPPRNDRGLHDLLEGSLILRRRIHDLHRLVRDKCVDLAVCRLSGVAIEAVLGGFGAKLPLRKLDLLHRCGDQVSRRLVELVPPRDIDVVGGHRPSDRKVIDVGRHLVPFCRIARAGAGHAAVGNATLERAVDLGKSDRHRLCADGGDEVVERGTEGADFSALEVGKAGDRLATPDYLCWEGINRDDLAAVLLEFFVCKGHQGDRSLAGLVDVRMQAREINSVEKRHVAGNGREWGRADVDLPGAHEAQDFRAVQAHLRPSRKLDVDLSV